MWILYSGFWFTIEDTQRLTQGRLTASILRLPKSAQLRELVVGYTKIHIMGRPVKSGIIVSTSAFWGRSVLPQ
jgi:hypothetical protein